jgi:hemoglobin-like flavoprotein
MTSEQTRQVQASFAKFVPIANQAAALSTAASSRRHPTRALFRGDMHVQGRKLMTALATVMNSLDRFEAIIPVVYDLATRHVGYGVDPGHYALIGTALLWTLEQSLGDEFTPELRAAWSAAYSALSEVMIAAAYSRRNETPERSSR